MGRGLEILEVEHAREPVAVAEFCNRIVGALEGGGAYGVWLLRRGGVQMADARRFLSPEPTGLEEIFFF